MSAEIIPLPLPPSGPERFRKPTFQEMQFYGKAISLPEPEIEKCFDYYESNGWKVGRNPMVNWQAAMRNWKRNLGKYSPLLPRSGTRYSQPPFSGNF